MKEEYIEIFDGKVNYITKNVEKSIPVEQFVSHLEQTMSVDTQILPRNCFYMLRDENRIMYGVEVQAGVRKVTWQNKSTGVVTTHMISIPYTQFYIRAKTSGALGEMCLSCTKTPITSLEDPIFVPPYPNIHSGGAGFVCTGSLRVSEGTALNVKIDSAVSGFFESHFNRDLTPSILSCFKGEPWTEDKERYLVEWENKTKEDRFFAISSSINYVPRKITVGDFIREKNNY